MIRVKRSISLLQNEISSETSHLHIGQRIYNTSSFSHLEILIELGASHWEYILPNKIGMVLLFLNSIYSTSPPSAPLSSTQPPIVLDMRKICQ